MDASRFVTRREALQAGALAAGTLAGLEVEPAAARSHEAAVAQRAPRIRRSFDQGWLFFRGDARGAEAPAFDDSSWRKLDVPHDWSIEDLPDAASDDGGATNDPSSWAFITDPAQQQNAPQVIGPFDKQNSPGGKQTGYTVGGVGWYRKHFTVPTLIKDESEPKPDSDEQRVELQFDGVYQDADIYLNGVHLGFHPHGYVSFAYDLTPQLRPGTNVLAVRVDNSGSNSRWYSGSGIYRHTWLTVTGPVRLPLWGTHITTPTVDPKRSVVRVAVPVDNLGSHTTAAQVRVTILDAAGRKVAARTSKRRGIAKVQGAGFQLDLPVAPCALWSPETPNLYRAKVDVLVRGKVVDSVTETFGIRSIAFSDKGFFLNGRPVEMRGGCCHHDNGALGSVSLYRSEERRVRTLKSLGYNALRTSHNPPSPALLDACDRLGLLVYDEFTDMWQKQKNPDDYHKHFADHWQADLTDFVMRDRNRPSVVIWSLANEIFAADMNDKTGSGSADYCKKLAALVRSLDSTRPITEGGDANLEARKETLDIGDVHYTTGQGSSGSSAGGAFFAPPDLNKTHADYAGKAVMQSESYPPAMWEAWGQVTDNAWQVGDFTWTAWDYIGEAAIGAPPLSPTGAGGAAAAYGLAGVGGVIPYPWYVSYCGDIDLIGQRKPQAYARTVLWGLSMVEMAVERPPPPGTQQSPEDAGFLTWGYYDELQSWTWDVVPLQPMKVRVYTPGDSVKLLLNGSEVATNSLSDSDKQHTTFTVPYQPGTLTAIASKAGQEIGRKTLTTAGAPSKLGLTADLAKLTTGRDDLTHVLVEVLDDQGRLVPDAVVKVDFAVSGAGDLAGVANANPHNVDSFKRPRRWTYHGQALAILRPAKTAGSLTLTASADGLAPATLTWPVVAPAKPQKRAKRTRATLAGLANVPAIFVLGAATAVLRRRQRLPDLT